MSSFVNLKSVAEQQKQRGTLQNLKFSPPAPSKNEFFLFIFPFVVVKQLMRRAKMATTFRCPRKMTHNHDMS